MKQITYYTPEQVAAAREVQSVPHLAGEHLEWSKRVLNWWDGFCQLRKKYMEDLRNIALATKAVWQSLKKFKSLKKALQAHKTGYTAEDYQCALIVRTDTNALYPPNFLKWAKKVLDWFKKKFAPKRYVFDPYQTPTSTPQKQTFGKASHRFQTRKNRMFRNMKKYA